MVGQRLTGYLQSCGLEAEDVPKVAGIFLGAKYCAWGTSIALAIRFQPLRRLFLSRREALFGQGLAASLPFSQRKRLWLVEALDTAKRRSGDNSASRALKASRAQQAFGSARQASSGSGGDNLSQAFTTRARRKLTAAAARSAVASSVQRLRLLLVSRLRKGIAAGIDGAKARYQAANYSWKLAGWQLLRTQERQRLGVALPKPGRGQSGGATTTWYSWSSSKYWQLSDKLEAAAGSSWYWSALTKSLNLNPKGMALGLAEGTILFKFTVPLHMPLMLFTIVQVFRQRHWAAAETSPPPVVEENPAEAESDQAHDGYVMEALAELDEAKSHLKLLTGAAHDANQLVGWLYSE
eukprot:gb/GFBE01053406.1/.p1 GENE.gb/GFBE01053406.1/~~gb/GFBE01053406.1/.p1  ORF type:complete len:352 (+),score=56.53 gb/GFBE01053406.1/:1-1056(+)